MKENSSYLSRVWHRLKKNGAAMTGLFIIIISSAVAMFAYWIAPDNSSNANLQTLEIQAKKPGYRQTFLLIKNNSAEKSNQWGVLIFGQPANDEYIPIASYRKAGNKLLIERYVDEDTLLREEYDLLSILNGKNDKISNHIITKTYWLGTDAFGRDILSRLIVGSRVSLAAGFMGVLVSLSIGILLGALAGYYKGRVDAIISWFINVNWSIPTLLLVFAITLLLGKGLSQIMLAIGLTMWVSVARLVRGQVLQVKELEYIEAAKALGFSNFRILFRHILPNISGPILVIAAGNFATAIILEAGLSFLGIGLQPPAPSWGLMIKENYNFIITHNPMLALIPGMAIMLLVLAFNLLGNGLRDAVDVKD